MLPTTIIWDTSYACPLKCTHCYSESGRRKTKMPSLDFLHQVATTFIQSGVKSVIFSGGEPLMVNGLLDVAQQLKTAGIRLTLFTNGWQALPPLEILASLFDRIHISLDGGNAVTHDRIRQRVGSFNKVLHTLSQIN